MASATLNADITAYIAGEDAAGSRLCRTLEPVIRTAVSRFLPASDPDRDDVVQETLMALLTYLRSSGRSPDRPEAFVVTMAGNRCRNLYWHRKRRSTVDLDRVPDPPGQAGDDPLRNLENAELDVQLQDAFARLDAPCRQLLVSIYVDGRPMDQLQREAGLTTVQGIFYRKYACLRKLGKLLNLSWFGGQGGGQE